MDSLTNKEIRQFEYQIAMDKIGIEGQQKIKRTKVVIAGLSAFGIAVARSLIAAGIGTMYIVDDNYISEKSLATQLLFSEEDVGKLKIVAFMEKLRFNTKNTNIEVFCTRLNKKNADIILSDDCKIIVTTAQDITVTEQILDLAEARNILVVGGAVNGWNGILGFFNKTKKTEFLNAVRPFEQTSNAETLPQTNFMSLALGGVLACHTTLAILNDYKTESQLYKFDVPTWEYSKIM